MPRRRSPRVLRLPALGRIGIGLPADVVVLSDDLESSGCSSRDARVSSAELPAAPARPEPGARFLEEIREQPEALLRLVAAEDEFARVAAEIRTRAATTIRMVGHGSSDNAASYGVYAFGLLPRWTALQDSISGSPSTTEPSSTCRAARFSLSRSPVAPLTSSSTRARQRVAARTRSPSRTTPHRSLLSKPTQSSSSGRPRTRRGSDEDLLEPDRRARSPRCARCATRS